MALKKGRKIFSLNYLFASFFGALMIASAYAYFNYRFAEYKFINFDKWIFYKKKDIFKPVDKEYVVVIYSSRKDDIKEILKRIKNKIKILAIDIYQKRFESSDRVIYLTTGINTILALIQRFNIYKVPSLFIIKKVKKDRYKQDSMIEAM
jgi:hypothetical protein